MQETQEKRVRSLDWEDPLEEEMATHSIILAWKISRTQEPGGRRVHGIAKSPTRLNTHTQTGLQRVRHDWTHTHTHTHTRTHTHATIVQRLGNAKSPTRLNTHTHAHTHATIVQRLGNGIFKTPCIKSRQRSTAATTSRNVQTTPKFHQLSTLLVSERRKAEERKTQVNRLGCGIICKVWVSKLLGLWRLERDPFALGLNLG